MAVPVFLHTAQEGCLILSGPFGSGDFIFCHTLFQNCRIPSHDTFGDVFSSVEPNAVRKGFDVCLVNMKEEIQRLKEHETTKHVVAFDGKTIRRSGNEKHKAHHVVILISEKYTHPLTPFLTSLSV